MGATLKQIAEIAQVSRGTVDRVIHGRYGVDPQTRARVLQIIKELDYNPNVMAKALRGMQTPFRIGAIVPNRNNPFFIEVNEGIDQASRAMTGYGMEVVKLEMEESTVQEQVRCIDALENMGVCGIMMVPVEHDDVRERINRLSASIPVITFNSDISGTKRMCFVGNDHTQAGRVAGHLMSTVVTKPGKVALLIGQKDIRAHVERIHGFQEYLAEDGRGDIEFIGPYMTYEREEPAYALVQNLLETEENLQGIYVAGGGQQSAARALANSSRAGSVHMICHDTLPETVEYVRKKVVDFTLGQEAFEQGYIPVALFRDYHMFNRKPKTKKIYTRIDIRSRENIDLKGYEYYAGRER